MIKKILSMVILFLIPCLFSCVLYRVPEINIDSEEIVLELYGNHTNIHITLIFFNEDDYAYSGKIGFPGQDYPAYTRLTGILPYNSMDFFCVESDGIDHSCRREESAYKDPLLLKEYTSEWYFYNDTFPSYSYHTMDISYSVSTICDPVSVCFDTYNRLCSYIIHTALSWGNTIPSLKITIENKEPDIIPDICFHLKDDYIINEKQTQASFSFNDIIPEEDLLVLYVSGE